MNKLINITTRYYIILFLVVMLGWSVVLYFVMKFEVYQNIDEVLYNRVNNVRSYAKKDSLNSIDPLADYTVSEISRPEFDSFEKDVYSDTLVFEPTDNEYDEYRKLTTAFATRDRYWKITVVRPRLESTEMLNTVALTLIPLSILMVVILALSARHLNAKLWKPFYDIVDYLSRYRVDKAAIIPEQHSNIVEFESLKKSVETLMQRNKVVFEQQKQFIENASHETQTPLAIIQSQMEILLQSPDLSEQQSEIIQSALIETDRLNRLNRTLLFISKIENQQFLEKSLVNIYELTNRLLRYFDEKKAKLNISVEVKADAATIMNTNTMLLEVMIGNLLKNAFAHNIENGSISIAISFDSFRIENSGKPLHEPKRIFERFYNKGEGADNWGLGLSIVKKIVEINQWRITYDWLDEKHIFTIHFN